MRATLSSTYRSLMQNLNTTSSRLNELQLTAASGKRMTKPSDDPSAIRPVLNARGQIRSSDRFLDTMGTAMDRMDSTDSYLGTVENLMARVKETLVGAGNAALNKDDLSTLGNQIRQIKDELVSVANANVNGKYIFAGFEEATKPFDGTPGVYSGDSSAIEFEIGPGEKVKVNLTGDEIFGDPGTGKDVWAVLDDIEAALVANDPATAMLEMDNLDASTELARSKRAEMGNVAQRVEQGMLTMEEARNDMVDMLARHEDADILQTFTDLTNQQTAFQAALQVTSQISKISILNYM